MNESSDIEAIAQITPVPMTFGQILDRIYRLMQKHYRLFLGIATVPTVIMLVLTGTILGFMFATLGPELTGHSSTPPVHPPWFPIVFVFIYPVILLAYALYLPAASFAAAHADRGVVVSFRKAYGVAWSRFGRSLWLMVLCMLILIVPIVVIALLIGAGAALMGHGAVVGSGPAYAFFLIPLLVLLYFGILVYSVLIMVRFAVAYPACIEEDMTAWQALKRSASLTSGAKGRIFLVLLVVYAVVYAVELACILVFLALAAFVAFAAMAAHVVAGSPAFFTLVGIGIFAYAIVIGVCILISYAAFTTALAVLYHDQRLRKDVLATLAPLA